METLSFMKMTGTSIGHRNGIAKLIRVDKAMTSQSCGMASPIGQTKLDGSNLLTKIISSGIQRVMILMIQGFWSVLWSSYYKMTAISSCWDTAQMESTPNGNLTHRAKGAIPFSGSKEMEAFPSGIHKLMNCSGHHTQVTGVKDLTVLLCLTQAGSKL